MAISSDGFLSVPTAYLHLSSRWNHVVFRDWKMDRCEWPSVASFARKELDQHIALSARHFVSTTLATPLLLRVRITFITMFNKHAWMCHDVMVAGIFHRVSSRPLSHAWHEDSWTGAALHLWTTISHILRPALKSCADTASEEFFLNMFYHILLTSYTNLL